MSGGTLGERQAELRRAWRELVAVAMEAPPLRWTTRLLTVAGKHPVAFALVAAYWLAVGVWIGWSL